MPRSLSEDTKYIYLWLWRLPWAAGADIARITGMKQNKVSNALKRGEHRGWLRSARLGRVFKAVDRFVFSNAGIEEMGRQFGWEPLWWHTANGVRALARRLEVLELAYRYLPGFWQSNAVSRPRIWVYGNMLADTGPGEPDRRELQLVELNWYQAALRDFHWLEKGPIEAIASYTNGSNEYLRLPVLWRGEFPETLGHRVGEGGHGEGPGGGRKVVGAATASVVRTLLPRHGDFHSGPGIRRDGPATLVGEQGEQQVFRGNAGHH